MKVAILLAGKGRRMGPHTEDTHKSLIPILDTCILKLLAERINETNCTECVPIVGFQGENVVNLLEAELDSRIKVKPVNNSKFAEYNNMYSLWCAKSLLEGQPFVLVNGDAVCHSDILKEAVNGDIDSGILIDDYNRAKQIDSPKLRVEGERIVELGRHIAIDHSAGYAMGIYRFSAQLSKAMFEVIEEMLARDEFQAGFHDPLNYLFEKFAIKPISTGGLDWTDLDDPEDIVRIEKLIEKIRSSERRVM